MSKASPPWSELGNRRNETDRRSNARLRFVAPAIGLTFFLIQIPFARIGFDSHHDGYMLAAAIGVKDGGVIHRDVVSQYGPITTLAHSLILLLPLGPALALRLFTAFQLALTAALVADLGRVAPKTWPLRFPFTASAALVWIVLSDAWRGVPILPWSSVTAGTLLSSAVWLLATGSRKSSTCTGFSVQAYFLLAGAFVGLTALTRVNVGTAAMLGSLAVALVFRLAGASPNRLVERFAFGVIASVLATLLALALASSLREFVQQAILNPLWFAPLMVEGWRPMQWLIATTAHYAPLSIVIAGAARLLGRPERTVRKVGAFLMLLTAVWLFSNPRPWASRLESFKRGFLQLADPTLITSNALLLALVSSALGCCALISIHLVRLASSTADPVFVITGVLAVAGTVQVFPTYDSRHIWWGMPLALALTLSTFGSLFNNKRYFAFTLVLFILPVLLSALKSANMTLGEPRTALGEETIWYGMMGTKSEVERLKEREHFVRTRVNSGSSIFLANDGDLSVLSGSFQSTDRYFVDWTFLTPSLLERSAGPGGRPGVISDRTVGELLRLANGTDYFIASRSANLTHLLAPPCIAGNCPGIEPNDVCMSWGSCRPRSTPASLELVPDSSFTPVTPWTDWNVKVNTGFSYPEDDGAWITGHHARLTFDIVPTDTVRVSLYPFLPPEWTHIDINILTDSEATPIRLSDGITTIDLPVKANTWNELVFRCDTLHRPSELGLSEDQRLLCAKVVRFEPIP